MQPFLAQLFAKIETLLSNPTDLFWLTVLFGVAVIALHFLAKTVAFIVRLALGLAILAAIIWLFF